MLTKCQVDEATKLLFFPHWSTFLNQHFRGQWPIGLGGKAESKCHLGMLNLRHSYLNIMKLENCGPAGECWNNNH